MIFLRTLKVMNKKMIDILSMTLKTPVSIHISSALPGGLFRPNKILRFIRLPWTIPDLHLPRRRLQAGQYQASFSVALSPQECTGSPEVAALTSLSLIPSKVMVWVQGNMSTLGTRGSHPGLEAPCTASNNIPCKTLLA